MVRCAHFTTCLLRYGGPVTKALNVLGEYERLSDICGKECVAVVAILSDSFMLVLCEFAFVDSIGSWNIGIDKLCVLGNRM